MSTQPKVTIAEAADLLGVSVDTVRRWDKKGLVKSQRSDANYRLFDIDELNRVAQKAAAQEHIFSNGEEYRILTSRPTKYTCIDLFAGCGGTALGFENAGLQHLLLSEKDKDAVSTLRRNRPGWNVIQGDVADLDFSSYKNKVDVVEGGFPCQAFSYAGKKRGFLDTRGTLFYEFARAVDQVKPKIAIGENVRGLLSHDNGRTLSTMVDVLSDIGYRVRYKVLRSQYLDVPQKRERLILFAVRNDIDVEPIFPEEQDYTITLRQALKDCPPSEGQEYSEAKKKVMQHVPEGGYWKDLPQEMQKSYMMSSYYMGGGKTGMARRLAWSEPSLTLLCTPAQKQTERCHPEETRPLSVREYARIQTFPDEWEFSGSISSKYRQIGNAVPVNMGYHLGKKIIDLLDSL